MVPYIFSQGLLPNWYPWTMGVILIIRCFSCLSFEMVIFKTICSANSDINLINLPIYRVQTDVLLCFHTFNSSSMRKMAVDQSAFHTSSSLDTNSQHLYYIPCQPQFLVPYIKAYPTSKNSWLNFVWSS